jgi:SAM-dependent methyltransferase
VFLGATVEVQYLLGGEYEAESMSEIRDRWAAGSTYEEFMGRWSRQLAPRFVSWLQIPGSVHWLDVGCGTGALANAICSHASPASVLGCDPAEPLIEYARSHSRDVRASFVVAAAGGLPRRAEGYGSVTSLLALNFFPDPEAAVHEMRSLAATQGTVSACVWDYGGKMEFLRYFWDTVASVDSTARELDEGERFPLCRPGTLADLLRAGGLSDVHCDPIEIPTEFTSFDDYWRPFLGGTGPAPSYVASLKADRCATLARKLEQSLPRGPAGTIALTARAWAVRGTAQ